MRRSGARFGRSAALASVVMPCRNAAATLMEAVASIQGQTHSCWELLLFDDGSTDASGDIGVALARGDSRIRLIRSGPVGIVEALRRACDAAQGEYIARMDADDVAHPARLEAQIALLMERPDVALCGAEVAVFGERVGLGRQRYAAWLNGLTDHAAMVRELFVECPIAHPTFLLRRETLDEVGGYTDRGWAEDYDLVMRLFLAGKRFAKVPRPLLRWRESPGRFSMRDARYGPARFRALKRDYLARSYLAGDRPFFQWGAGEVGKPWLREWGEHRPLAVVDIHPRKIGRCIHGYGVMAPEDLPVPGAAFVVVAVGAPGARDEIRAWMRGRGYGELEDYLFLA